MRPATFIFSLLATVAIAFPAAAQSERAAAVDLFDEGRAAMHGGNLEVACSKFAESNRLDPAVGTAFNLANCEEQRGRLATAWALFKEVAGRMKADDPRLRLAHERISALSPRVPRLVLINDPQAPPGTRARVDNQEVASSNFGAELPVDPGTHRVLVGAPNAPARTIEVTIVDGETLRIALIPAAETAPHTREDLPTSVPRAKEQPLASRRILGLDPSHAALVASGVGIAGVAVGIIAGVVGLNAQDRGNDNCSSITRTCNQSGYDANQRAKTMAAVSSVGFVVGIVGGGAATYLFLTAPAGGTSKHAASVGIGGRW